MGGTLPEYSTTLFLDSNIVLEGLPLEDLPWSDLARSGPLVILFTPRVLKEVDSKKRDGRLGERARAFNRLLSSAVSQREPIPLVTIPIQVDLGIAECDRIPWSNYDDLQPDDADATFIAEVLNVRGVPAERRLVVSQDLHPLVMARRHGLGFFHAPASWLRPRETSPLERENARLRERVLELEKTEPKIKISFSAPERVTVLKVRPLGDGAAHDLAAAVLRAHPQPEQSASLRSFGMHDASLDERCSVYARATVPAFVREVHTKLELQHNLVPISFNVTNQGLVAGLALRIEVTFSGGWMNDNVILVIPPTAPKVRDSLGSTSSLQSLSSLPVSPRDEPIKRAERFVVDVDDLRHEQTWTWSGYAWIDVSTPKPAVMAVRVTAANLRGTVRHHHRIEKCVEDVEVAALIDFETQEHLRNPPGHADIQESLRTEAFDRMDIESGGESAD